MVVSSGSAADQSRHLRQIPLGAAFPSFLPGVQPGGGCVVPSVYTAPPCTSCEGLPAHPSSWVVIGGKEGTHQKLLLTF